MSVNSMTGYGRAQQLVNGRDISVEMKAVNHRFFEFSARIPRAYSFLEEKLKSFVYKAVSRGKIDVNVSIIALEGAAANVAINLPLARSYSEELRALGRELSLPDDLALSSFTRLGDIFIVRRLEEDEAALWADVSAVAGEALQALLQMRRTEGEALCSDILERLVAIEALVGNVEELAPKTVEAYRARLYQKLGELLADRQIDEARLLSEAAIFAERIAVAEETVRLRSHVAQFRQILGQPGPVGKKLDFLLQEFNREANTIGSKAQDMEVSRVVVELKSKIESIREQIQNIE